MIEMKIKGKNEYLHPFFNSMNSEIKTTPKIITPIIDSRQTQTKTVIINIILHVELKNLFSITVLMRSDLANSL